MAEILALYEVDGQTIIGSESRNDVRHQLLQSNIIYSEDAGEGTKTFVLQNISATLTAQQVNLTTLQAPYDPDTSQQLTQQFSFFRKDTKVWTDWSNSILIDEIPPGENYRVRIRMVAAAGVNPTSYGGVARMIYDALTA